MRGPGSTARLTSAAAARPFSHSVCTMVPPSAIMYPSSIAPFSGNLLSSWLTSSRSSSKWCLQKPSLHAAGLSTPNPRDVPSPVRQLPTEQSYSSHRYRLSSASILYTTTPGECLSTTNIPPTSTCCCIFVEQRLKICLSDGVAQIYKVPLRPYSQTRSRTSPPPSSSSLSSSQSSIVYSKHFRTDIHYLATLSNTFYSTHPSPPSAISFSP